MMETIDIITAWEKRNNMFEVGHIRGFDFYSYMRRDFVNAVVNQKNKVSTDPFVGKGQKDSGLKLFKKLLGKSEKTGVKNPDLLILCHPRRNRVGDVYESVFTDYLEEEFPNSLTLERMFDDHVHFEPALTKNICYTDRITLKSYIYRLIASKLNKKEYNSVKNEIKAIMEGPISELEAELSIDARKKTYYDKATVMYYFYKSRKPDYIRFIKKVKPKLVVEVVSKSIDAMLVNEVCADMNIPVLEIQHSLLGPIAVYPDGIYEKQSPDYYISYADYWSDYQTYPIKDENVFACGSPYFERQIKAYKGNNKVVRDKKQILFISGPTYGHALAKLAIELKNASNDTVDIIYKLHPDEFGFWKEWYPELARNDINVIDSKDVSIYEFFNNADAQVGVFSTAIYEGLGFDLDTYILDNPFAGEFVKFCQDGYGTLVTSGQELYDALSDGHAVPEGLSEKFWKSNARENVVEVIRSILK